MPVFVCDNCGCLENTALSNFWGRTKGEPALCSECDPFIGKWHNRFEKKKWNGDPKGIVNKDPNEPFYFLR